MPQPAKNTIEPILNPDKKICLCKSIQSVISFSRLLGVSSLQWTHENGRCVFRRSLISIAWSFVLVVLLILHLVFYAEFDVLSTKNVLPIILDGITDLTYYSYLILIMVVSCLKSSSWAKVLNQISRIIRYGILCDSALNVIRKLSITFLIFFLILLLLDIGMLCYLHFSLSYETKFSFGSILGKLIQNGVLLFYVILLTNIAVLIGAFTCFEKLSLKALKYNEIYPMKKITGSDNKQDIFVFFSYKVCGSEHDKLPPELLKLTTAEIIEYLRILHEELSEIMYSMNSCLNPLLLAHFVIEIVLLVINWYSIIIGLAYTFDSPDAETIFILNVEFAILHTVGLFIFLRNAQKLYNLVHGYNCFLMEFSSRVSSPADHLQLRIFIEKIKQHQTLSANGIFSIDLGIAGPIFANILTYVLVALQFKIPQ